jgi:hypothetical protein
LTKFHHGQLTAAAKEKQKNKTKKKPTTPNDQRTSDNQQETCKKHNKYRGYTGATRPNEASARMS